MAIWVNETHVGGTIEPLRVAKVVLEARVTLFKSVNFKAAWSLSQNIFVYKFSVQENLYYHNKLQQQTAQIVLLQFAKTFPMVCEFESSRSPLSVFFDSKIITSHRLFA